MSFWQVVCRALGAILFALAAVLLIGGKAIGHMTADTRAGIVIAFALVGAALGAIISRQ